eukprot:3523708-Pyramimonas_sp.AAC.3
MSRSSDTIAYPGHVNRVMKVVLGTVKAQAQACYITHASNNGRVVLTQSRTRRSTYEECL